jgi:hypothetical protein
MAEFVLPQFPLVDVDRGFASLGLLAPHAGNHVNKTEQSENTQARLSAKLAA